MNADAWDALVLVNVGPVVIVPEEPVDPEPAPVLEALVTDVVNPELPPVLVVDAVLAEPVGFPTPPLPVAESDPEPPSPTVHPPLARFAFGAS